MNNWFGKDCKYQVCQFEGWWNENNEYEEDKTFPLLIYCRNEHNPIDCEGNCNLKNCPLSKE